MFHKDTAELIGFTSYLNHFWGDISEIQAEIQEDELELVINKWKEEFLFNINSENNCECKSCRKCLAHRFLKNANTIIRLYKINEECNIDELLKELNGLTDF